MAKIYVNKKTSVTTVSGQVTEVSSDRKEFKVLSKQWNPESKQMDDNTLSIITSTPLQEDVAVGKNVTVCGFTNPIKQAFEAMFVEAKSGCFELNDLSVVRGEVVKAEMNEEKNADGTNKVTREGKARKPHFDIKVSTIEPDPASEKGETRRVLHTIKVYAMTQSDGSVNTANLDRVKKIFGNYDRNENPATVTVVTSPADATTRENEVNGKVYVNTYVNHLGFKSIDVEWGKERTKDKDTAGAEEKKEDPAPAVTAEVKNEPVQTGSGFEAVNTEGQEIEDLDPETMFI